MHASAAQLRSAFLSAQLGGARRDALTVVSEALERGLTVPQIHCEVIRPAQHEVGELWARNAIGVAQEHVATGIASLAVSWLYPRLPRGNANGKRVLMACVEGEHHELGARLVSDFLEMAGFEVSFVGADVPTDSLVLMARSTSPDLVALSMTMTLRYPALEQAVRRLREECPDVRIVAGGRALESTPELTKTLGLPNVGSDPAEVVLAAESAVGLAQ